MSECTVEDRRGDGLRNEPNLSTSVAWQVIITFCISMAKDSSQLESGNRKIDVSALKSKGRTGAARARCPRSGNHSPRPSWTKHRSSGVSETGSSIRPCDVNRRYAHREKGNHKGCSYKFERRALWFAVARVGSSPARWWRWGFFALFRPEK